MIKIGYLIVAHVNSEVRIYSLKKVNSILQNRSRNFIFVNSDTGSTLLELMVAVGIMSIVMLGMISVQNASLATQKQAQIVSTAQEIQAHFRNLITDQQSWSDTMNQNSSPALGPSDMTCLTANTSCTGKGGPFTIYEHGQIPPKAFYPSLPSTESDGQGFTEAGETPCPSGNYLHSGSTQCPLAYYVTWKPRCAGNCVNPPIEINVQLFYYSGSSAIPVNTKKYSIMNFVRAATHLDKNFSLIDKETGPGGICGSTVKRNFFIAPAGDPFGLVTGPTELASSNVFTLQTPGTYKCTGTAVGYGVGGFQLKLENSTTGAVLGTTSGYAPTVPPGQASATFQAVFSISTATSFNFVQECTASSSTSDLGFGVGTNNYASLICTLID